MRVPVFAPLDSVFELEVNVFTSTDSAAGVGSDITTVTWNEGTSIVVFPEPCGMGSFCVELTDGVVFPDGEGPAVEDPDWLTDAVASVTLTAAEVV